MPHVPLPASSLLSLLELEMTLLNTGIVTAYLLPPCYSALDAPLPSAMPGIQYVFNNCMRSELHGVSPLKGALPTR